MYKLLCNGFSIVFTFIEDFFLKKNVPKSNLLKNGYDCYFENNSLFEKKIKKYRYIIKKKYQRLFIFSDTTLNEIVEIVFSKNFREYLTLQTGFKYSIDFITSYQNLHISRNDYRRNWYGNNFHFDKPYTKNMLKVMVPIHKIEEKDGPLSLFDKNISRSYGKGLKLFRKRIKLIGKSQDKLIFLPNVCLHKADNPYLRRSAKLIMFQLNPSSEWSVNKKITQRQKYKEPKFPFFSYFFDKRFSIES
ncbi:MAG: hypothetical protein JJ840_07645 [Prochlorococcus marinus CUG1431]|uniref:Uncharacterized protein n=1 Tax=Prochlorococcus marinus CUG1433 TaxID=2774506 RepID=A0A9D9BSA2_PROMR|nr:hypothetical protein [Prochlorococcus marinus CUG1433]MBO6981219.1 hypothetical protein [Prochlorococcus marinus CUG1431]